MAVLLEGADIELGPVEFDMWLARNGITRVVKLWRSVAHNPRVVPQLFVLAVTVKMSVVVVYIFFDAEASESSDIAHAVETSIELTLPDSVTTVTGCLEVSVYMRCALWLSEVNEILPLCSVSVLLSSRKLGLTLSVVSA